MSWRSRSNAALALLILAVVPFAAYGGELIELHRAFVDQAHDLEVRIDQYGAVRESEDGSLTELAELNRRLDRELGQLDSSAAELRRLERALALARDHYLAASADSAVTRRELSDGMTALEDLGRRLQELGVSATADHDGVDGSWRVEVSPQEVVGLLSLAQSGPQVNGSYRLSNGALGSVRGTFSNRGGLRLELFDAESGAVAVIRGSLDSESGELVGEWNAHELGGGRPTSGGWWGRRISLEQTLEAVP